MTARSARRVVLIGFVFAVLALVAARPWSRRPDVELTAPVLPVPGAAHGPVPSPVSSTPAQGVRTSPIVEPDAPRLAEVRFVGDQGEAIPSASLDLVADGKRATLGVANEDGCLRIPASAIEARECLAQSPGHCTELVLMPDRVESVTIKLTALSSISGIVRVPDGSPPKIPIVIAASLEKAPPTCEQMAGQAAAAPLLSATTDDAGAFSIRGLDPRAEYWLSGAGPGYLVEWPPSSTRPGGPPIELRARPLYGVRVVLLGRENEAIGFASGLSKNGSLLAQCTDREAKDAILYSNQIALAGIQGIECIRIAGPESLEFVYVCDVEKERVGPIVMTIDHPAYRKQTRMMFAPRISNSMPAEVLQLEPIDQPTGALRLEFLPAGFELEMLSTLRLDDLSGKEPLFLTIPRISSKPLVTEGIPCGEYTVRFRTCEGLLRVPRDNVEPELRVSILPDREALLVVDLGEPRILEVSFRGEHGLEYSGPITVRVISQVTQRAQHLSFSAPPYFIPGLPVGPHSVAGMRGHSAAPRIGAEEFRATVDIQDVSFQSVRLDSRRQVRVALK